MPTPEERLVLAADLAENASAIASDFANGSSGRNVTPEPIAGPLPTLAEFLRQKETEINDNANLIAGFADDLGAPNSTVLVGGVQARLLASELINVKSFGAVGDGVTDDTAAIQAAIDHAVANQGTVFFPATPAHYSLRSVHPTHTSTFLYVAPTGFLNKVGFKGGAPQTKIQVDVDIPGAVSLMLFDGGPGGVQSIDRRIEDLSFFGGPNSISRWVDHCLLGKDGYHPNMTITACQFYGSAVSCIRLATYVTTMTNVRTAWAPIGFHLEGPSPTDVITSITMNSCYGIDHGTNAYKFGYLTYSSLNACAADGIRGYAYEFNIARGVTMNGCGSESSDRLIKVGSFFGFHVNTFMTLSIGNDETPPDTLIEFTRGSSATIRGIINHAPKAFGKVFKLLTNEWGSECVVFPDSSVSPEQCEFAVSNFAFDQPLKFLVYDNTQRSRSWSVTDQATLVSTINTVLNNKNVIHNVVIQLPDGDLNITSPLSFFGGLTRGTGTITFQGGVNSRIVVTGDGKVDFLGSPESLDIIFKDCALHMDVISSGQGFTFAGRKTRLVNASITSHNGAVQWAILNGCNMFIDSTSSITTPNFSSGSFKCEVAHGASPKSGTYPPRTIQYKTTPTAGEIGWIWGAGWVAFG